MDEEIETLVIAMRADTSAFKADVNEMKAALEGPFADAAKRAGAALESVLTRAILTGKLGLDDLRRAALGVLNDIAKSAIRAGLGAIGGGGKGGFGGGIGGGLGALLAGALGLPGRATGGPVSQGRGYLVGERGPEIFVPASAGQVQPGVAARGAVHITVNVMGGGGAGTRPADMARSGRQVARAVRAALVASGD